MSTTALVVLDVATKNSAEMPIAEHDHMIEALPPYGSDQSLYIRILPGRSCCRHQLSDAHGVQTNCGPRGRRTGPGIQLSAQRRNRRKRRPRRDCPGRSASLVTADQHEPCVWRRSLNRFRCQASAARHGYAARPRHGRIDDVPHALHQNGVSFVGPPTECDFGLLCVL